jgi:acyl-CoA synthetase (AMP-forming)/AMP-acid ligase II
MCRQRPILAVPWLTSATVWPRMPLSSKTRFSRCAWKEVYSEVAALSEALRGPLGLSAGDRVGLIATATDEFFQASLTAACNLAHACMPHMALPLMAQDGCSPAHHAFHLAIYFLAAHPCIGEAPSLTAMRSVSLMPSRHSWQSRHAEPSQCQSTCAGASRRQRQPSRALRPAWSLWTLTCSTNMDSCWPAIASLH